MRENGKVVGKAVYTILGVNLEGRKEVLGLYISEHEGANFWLQVLTDLSNRGIKDILIACVDGLKGPIFPEAIESHIPEHGSSVVRGASDPQKIFSEICRIQESEGIHVDLKRVYKAANKDLAASELDILADKWEGKYPIVIKSWRNNWERLSQYSSTRKKFAESFIQPTP